jgi:hypothetical protein
MRTVIAFGDCCCEAVSPKILPYSESVCSYPDDAKCLLYTHLVCRQNRHSEGFSQSLDWVYRLALIHPPWFRDKVNATGRIISKPEAFRSCHVLALHRPGLSRCRALTRQAVRVSLSRPTAIQSCLCCSFRFFLKRRTRREKVFTW